MRIAIFSDIHANLEALLAVRSCYAWERVDRFLCGGDVVGYGGSPDECVEIVKAMNADTVLGNHDAAVAGRMDYSYYYEAARGVLDIHTRLLRSENVEWLKQLPYSRRYEEYGIELCHGSPIHKEEFDYIFTPEQARMLIPHYRELEPVTFIGHSHLCRVFSLGPDGVLELPPTLVRIEKGRKYVISVGSIGQPRDYDNRACFTVYDVEAGEVVFHRIEYDIETSAQRISDIRLERSFGDRLFIGI